MSNVTEKIQVLISKQDMTNVNTLLMKEALENGERPIPLSTFVRDLIKKYIEDNKNSLIQHSFVKNDIARYVNKMKNDKINMKENGK